jgi:hypothetical protein
VLFGSTIIFCDNSVARFSFGFSTDFGISELKKAVN